MARIAAALIAFWIIPFANLSAQDGKFKLPFDNEKRDANFEAQRTWLIDGMKKGCEKNPKWDEDAGKVIEGFAVMATGISNMMPKEVGEAALRAIEAGSKDPLMYYAVLRSNVAHPMKQGYKNRLEVSNRVVEGFLKSSYPAHRKLYALISEGLNYAVASKGGTDEQKAGIRRLLVSALDMLKESTRTDECNLFRDIQLHNACMEAIRGFMALGDNSETALETVDKVLAECKDFEAGRLRVKGAWMVTHAWEARGNKTIDKVTDDGYKTFKERLTAAGELLDKAWEKQQSPVAMERRMWVEIGLGGGDRGQMEKWFARAVSNTREDYGAAIAMKEWVHPKWHGDVESLREFAVACRDSGRHREAIALLYFDIFYPLNVNRDKATEKDICKDPQFIKEVNHLFAEYFKYYPEDTMNRGRYAVFCYYSMQYKECLRHFDIVGDRFKASSGFSIEFQKKIKQFVQDSYKPEMDLDKFKEELQKKKDKEK